MKTNNLNQIIIDEDDMIDVIYRDKNVKKIVVNDENWIKQFKEKCEEYDLPFEIEWSLPSTLSEQEFIDKNFSEWHLPESYKNLDMRQYLLDKCKNDIQRQRVNYEMDEFEKRNMALVIKWLKYFVDKMSENNLIWGVGRGSSCASFCLYLLGVHCIDPIKYELPLDEFLK